MSHKDGDLAEILITMRMRSLLWATNPPARQLLWEKRPQVEAAPAVSRPRPQPLWPAQHAVKEASSSHLPEWPLPRPLLSAAPCPSRTHGSSPRSSWEITLGLVPGSPAHGEKSPFVWSVPTSPEQPVGARQTELTSSVAENPGRAQAPPFDPIPGRAHRLAC